jgi:hypothetical protein
MKLEMLADVRVPQRPFFIGMHAAPKGSARPSPRPSRKRSKMLERAIRPS